MCHTKTITFMSYSYAADLLNSYQEVVSSGKSLTFTKGNGNTTEVSAGIPGADV